MMVASVNVGQPRRVETPTGTVLTSIFKSPAAGRLAVRAHNIDGDRQSDLTVHGGPYKAVYGYAEEHYEYWRAELPDYDFRAGNFGENLTTQGLDEKDVCVGDRFRIGSAILQVTQPRMPCFKLGIRFGRADMVKRFWLSGRSGFTFQLFRRAASLQVIQSNSWAVKPTGSALRMWLRCIGARRPMPN